jgi:hypothetical protein
VRAHLGLVPIALPAAATTTMPASTTCFTAAHVALPAALAGASPPRLRLTTRMPFDRPFLASHSSAWMTLAKVPLPFSSRTRSANSGVPGATPTTPAPVFLAPMVPETWVPVWEGQGGRGRAALWAEVGVWTVEAVAAEQRARGACKLWLAQGSLKCCRHAERDTGWSAEAHTAW